MWSEREEFTILIFQVVHCCFVVGSLTGATASLRLTLRTRGSKIALCPRFLQCVWITSFKEEV